MAQSSKKTAAKKRRGPGRPFQKGQSGNPGGRPAIPNDVIESARARTALAIDTLAAICEGGEDEKARISAAVALLDRAWGKPGERVQVSGGDRPVELAVEPMSDEERVSRIAELFARAQARRKTGERPEGDR